METKQLQLVNFKQAKRLKEAGFDWYIEDVYWNDGEYEHNYADGDWNCEHDEGCISAPSVALALKWFRDVKCQLSELMYTDNGRFYYRIKLLKWSEASTNSFNTYELAESALLDELLTLIEKEK